MYKYIKGCGNTILTMSSSVNLWQNMEDGNYYISRDYMDIDVPKIDYSYTLLYDNQKPPKYKPYKNNISNPKKITNAELSKGIVEYEGSGWFLDDKLRYEALLKYENIHK